MENTSNGFTLTAEEVEIVRKIFSITTLDKFDNVDDLKIGIDLWERIKQWQDGLEKPVD